MDIIHAFHGMAVDRYDQVPFPDTGFVGRAALVDRCDLDAVMVFPDDRIWPVGDLAAIVGHKATNTRRTVHPVSN